MQFPSFQGTANHPQKVTIAAVKQSANLKEEKEAQLAPQCVLEASHNGFPAERKQRKNYRQTMGATAVYEIIFGGAGDARPANRTTFSSIQESNSAGLVTRETSESLESSNNDVSTASSL